MASSSALLVATVKDEGPNILEWVAHHRLSGFNKIMVFQNGSTDYTVTILRVLDQLDIIDFHENPIRRGSAQKKAYVRASATDAFKEHEYCIALDGDEFLTVHIGDGTVHDLLGATDHPDLIRLNWRNFGSSGQTALSQELVTERFSRAPPRQALATSPEGYKTLFRTGCFGRIGVHQPRFPTRETISECNGSGLKSGDYRLLNWRSTDPKCASLAQINHYPIRDAASFVLKVARGSAHQMNRAVDLKYWQRFDRNDEQDLSLAGRSAGIRAEMERLDMLSNGRLLRLRRRALRSWRQRFLRLRDENAAYRDLYEQLTASHGDATRQEKSPA